MSARKKVVSIIGTRPEAIKMAPILHKLYRIKKIESILITTSQHIEMLKPFLQSFKLSPDYNLNIMRKNQTLPGIAFRTISKLEKIFRDISPDMVLVQGDTTSAVAAAMTAFYMNLSVGHVEAGLRSMNPYNPYPEEMNRRIISRLSTLHFAPTSENVSNLKREGIKSGVSKTGNSVVDAINYILKSYKKSSQDRYVQGICGDAQIILVTAHRRENHGDNLINICKGLIKIAENYPHYKIIYPVHLNPNVWNVVREQLSFNENIILLKPVEYIEFILLMKRSHFIISDSGGVQEEAPLLGKPVLVLRKNTERPEGIKAGAVKLIGTSSRKIYHEAKRLIEDNNHYKSMSRKRNLYGDGNTSSRICKILIKHFGID